MKEGDIVYHDGKLKEVDWLRINTVVVRDIRSKEAMVTTPDRVQFYADASENKRF